MRPSQKQITPEQLAFAQAHALVRIVDDEADLREALSFVLDMEGWKTVTYGRAEDFFTAIPRRSRAAWCSTCACRA